MQVVVKVSRLGYLMHTRVHTHKQSHTHAHTWDFVDGAWAVWVGNVQGVGSIVHLLMQCRHEWKHG